MKPCKNSENVGENTGIEESNMFAVGDEVEEEESQELTLSSSVGTKEISRKNSEVKIDENTDKKITSKGQIYNIISSDNIAQAAQIEI
eukprot:UN27873